MTAVLLRARTENVWGSFPNQAIEVPDTRSRLEVLAGASGAPQLLLRLGYGPEPQPTPRRRLPQVMLHPRNLPIRIH